MKIRLGPNPFQKPPKPKNPTEYFVAGLVIGLLLGFWFTYTILTYQPPGVAP